MIEDMKYKKLVLDESNVKLELSYIPMVFGCEEQLIISDCEDLFFLPNLHREPQMSFVCGGHEYIRKSRATFESGESLFGMNYEEL